MLSLQNLSFPYKTNKQQRAKEGVGDSWYVFYLSIKFVLLIVLRLFIVPGFNLQICISLSIKYSSASLLLDGEFTAKAQDWGWGDSTQSKLTLNSISLGRQKRISDAFVAWILASVRTTGLKTCLCTGITWRLLCVLDIVVFQRCPGDSNVWESLRTTDAHCVNYMDLEMANHSRRMSQMT